MNDCVFSFAGVRLHARPDGSLWWPDEGVLCVSDLHLGKSERIARRGGTLLPPYETQETLWRLDQAITETDPATVICLGDSFDDLGAAMSLAPPMQSTISRLQAGRAWVWIEGNHDPGPIDLGGTHVADLSRAGIVFRHIATPSGLHEVSGHYHPKSAIPGLAPRPCFLKDRRRLIMPAFGAYTGGLNAKDAVLADLMDEDAIAILTGKRATPIPLSAIVTRAKHRH